MLRRLPLLAVAAGALVAQVIVEFRADTVRVGVDRAARARGLGVGARGEQVAISDVVVSVRGGGNGVGVAGDGHGAGDRHHGGEKEGESSEELCGDEEEEVSTRS